jgi:hypothetical protein
VGHHLMGGDTDEGGTRLGVTAATISSGRPAPMAGAPATNTNTNLEAAVLGKMKRMAHGSHSVAPGTIGCMRQGPRPPPKKNPTRNHPRSTHTPRFSRVSEAQHREHVNHGWQRLPLCPTCWCPGRRPRKCFAPQSQSECNHTDGGGGARCHKTGREGGGWPHWS